MKLTYVIWGCLLTVSAARLRLKRLAKQNRPLWSPRHRVGRKWIGTSITASALVVAFIASATHPVQASEMDQQLIAAASRGDTAQVSRLLKRGAEINARDWRGRTPVLAATYGNHAATVHLLVSAGADVNARDIALNNPLLYSGAEGLLEILQLVVKAGADPRITNRYGGTALIPAAERGHVEVVRFLLTHTTVDVNHVNNLGWTALLEAVLLSDGGPRQQEIVAELICHGAIIDLPDRLGRTPLHHAKALGYKKIEVLLVAAGARS